MNIVTYWVQMRISTFWFTEKIDFCKDRLYVTNSIPDNYYYFAWIDYGNVQSVCWISGFLDFWTQWMKVQSETNFLGTEQGKFTFQLLRWRESFRYTAWDWGKLQSWATNCHERKKFHALNGKRGLQLKRHVICQFRDRIEHFECWMYVFR